MIDIRKHKRTGRPLCGVMFVEKLELAIERSLKRGKPGPKSMKYITN